MCGRYAIYTVDDIEDRFDVELNGIEMSPNYNVAPGQTNPVITQDGLELMKWGLIPRWAKDKKIGYKMINARSESVFEKTTWKQLITKKKCLIPANGFYEWQKRDGGKQPFYIKPEDQDLFAFAGLWETWTHEGKDLHTYTILTTTPNEEMEEIHDRMPVIIHQGNESQWLFADTEEDIKVLLQPYGDKTLEMFEVSKDVNTVKINNETLIGPVNSK